MRRFRISVIGAGKVGTGFAWHLHRLGYEVCDIRDKDPEKVKIVWKLLNRIKKRRKNEIFKTEVVFFTLPDSEIRKEFLRKKNAFPKETIFVHCSGVYGADLFYGVEALALHPVKSFFSVEQAIADLPGGFFVLDGTPKGLRFGKELVRALKGKPIVIPSDKRALYHTMCVFTSNFINALFDGGERIGKKIGIAEGNLREMLFNLGQGVLNNIRKKGPLESLTGPVKRGDISTVRLHIKVLKEEFPELVPIYKDLTKHLEGMIRTQNGKNKNF